MRFTVCESTNPEIKTLLQRYYVLWYNNVDFSHDYFPYATGLSTFTLPLIAVISTSDPDNYLDRTTSYQTKSDFFTRLTSHIGDIDHSVSISLQDAILTLQCLTSSTQTTVYADGDINGDGKIGSAEAIFILQKLAQ